MQSINIYSASNEGSKELQGPMVNRWGPGSSTSLRGVKCVIVGEEVYTDKLRDRDRLRETGKREKSQLKACGSEGNGKGTDSHREPSFESFSTQAEWPPDSG